MNSDELLPCGVYKTTVALRGKEEQVPAGRLVYFHNHSEQGPPIVLLPASNTHNKWTFHTRGYLVEDEKFLASLQHLPREGFYVLKATLSVGSGGFLPEKSLVQLGYNAKAEPILFPGKRIDNSIVFPTKGAGFKSHDIFKELEEASFLIQSDKPPESKPNPTPKPTLH